MATIAVNDKVRIIQALPGEEGLLKKVGRVVMVVDGEKCLVVLDDGSSANVNMKQLTKVT